MCSAISFGESARSIIPVAIAARGMPSYLAESGVCAIVMPPTALISLMPIAPSEAVPDRMTPMARSCAQRARDSKKTSMGLNWLRS